MAKNIVEQLGLQDVFNRVWTAHLLKTEGLVLNDFCIPSLGELIGALEVTVIGETGLITLTGKGSEGAFFNPQHFNPQDFFTYDYVHVELEGDSGEVELE